MPNSFSSIRGFTLIELLVTLSVAVVVLTLGVPSFQWVIERSRLSSAGNTLLATVQFAKAESLRRNLTVVVCPANPDQTNCVNSWENDWIVWADVNNNNSVDADEILRTESGQGSITWVSSTDRIRFNSRGRALDLPEIEVKPTECSGSKSYKTYSLTPFAGFVTSDKMCEGESA